MPSATLPSSISSDPSCPRASQNDESISTVRRSCVSASFNLPARQRALPTRVLNFPSYPSAHACLSGAQTTILGATFPSEKQALDSMAEQAALSRVYGGLHYRFDGNEGLRLGRRVAGLALSDDVHGIQPFTLR